jgi:Na+-driven multidrug efflux pump
MIFIIALLLSLAVVGGIYIVDGWILMLILGAIHSAAGSWPHPGLWISVGISLLAQLFSNAARPVIQKRRSTSHDARYPAG